MAAGRGPSVADDGASGGVRYVDLNQRGENDATLRPRSLAEFVGQDRVRTNLKIAIDAAKQRGEALEHVLLSGLPGLGKTTLSHVLATELGVELRVTSGPALERTGDLVGILTNLRAGDILFIDEIHRLPRVVEEYLYSAMEDLAIDIVIDQGAAARSVRLNLERFTLVGATTREGLLTAPFRARFGLLEKLELYPVPVLVQILRRSARLLAVDAGDDVLQRVAERSRGTPRVANRLLRRVRDLAQVRGAAQLTTAIADESLANLGIDHAGLEETDRKILRCLDRVGGGPVGIKTISAAVGEEEDTLETVYEPYLLTLGFLEKTPRGRRITDTGLLHLGVQRRGARGAAGQAGLFPT